MQGLSPRQRYWSVSASIAQWWRGRIAARAEELPEAARLGAGKVEHLTQGSDQTPSDPSTPMSCEHDRPNLLGRRMVALDLDPYELALSEPALARHLQRVCTSCDSPGQCLSDLAREPANPAWQEYCPNARTLNMLSALQTRSKAAPKFTFPYVG